MTAGRCTCPPFVRARGTLIGVSDPACPEHGNTGRPELPAAAGNAGYAERMGNVVPIAATRVKPGELAARRTETNGLARIELTLPVNPVPQSRPVTIMREAEPGARPRTFRAHTKRLTEFYRDVQQLAHLSRAFRSGPLTGTLRLYVVFFRRCRRAEDAGDLSNLVKALEDAGNRLMWADDGQIYELHASFGAIGPAVVGRIALVIEEFVPGEGI